MSTALEEAEPLHNLPNDVFDDLGFKEAMEIMDGAPKYLFEDDCMTAIRDHGQGVAKSLEAMAVAGVCRLPYPYLMIEYNWGGPTIALLSESKEYPETPFRINAMQCMRLDQHGVDVLVLSPSTIYASNAYTMEDGHKGLKWKARLAGWNLASDNSMELARKTFDYWKPCVEPGLVAALLLLNTRGIEKEVIEAPHALNKQRAKKNRPPIPQHTVIRIGHVYSKSGQQINVPREGQGTGRRMPMHLHPGYTASRWISKRHEKWQAHLANDEGLHTHLVYVEPYMVNFDPAAAEVPVPQTRVKW